MSVIAPPASNPATTRRQMIADRQKRSAAWWIVHRLGSLNFALVLLATIAVACAVATFTESGLSTKVARAYIYRNPLFHLWLGLLCVNLAAVTITRWPWQRRHIGFVVTHYGIITLLIGATIGMRAGFEGNVVLHKDQPPVGSVTTSRSVLQLESPADRALYIADFDVEAARPSEKKPALFPVPRTDATVVIDTFSANMVREEKLAASTAPGAAPGVLLRFTSAALGRTTDLPLLLEDGRVDDEDFFGLARVVLRPDLPPVDAAASGTVQMIFARTPPVAPPGVPSAGVNVTLSEDGSLVRITSPSGNGATYRRSEIQGHPVEEAGAVVTVQDYWPDFVMENGRPATRSVLPNNPAALVRISAASAAGNDNKPRLEVAPSGDAIAYRLLRSGAPYASGTAGVGESFALGWADWQATVVQAETAAVRVTDIKPGPDLPRGQQGIPGFRARLRAGSHEPGPARWVESGQVVTLSDGRQDARIGYGLEVRPLPFSLRLVNFEVPRDEGTDSPSDFRATVEFRDTATGATKTGLARMNQPASFPGTLWANLTGFNYKFSQAEWNPQDLGQTTLQVLYDPGWLLKWIGSLGIVIGIAIMFYWKPGGAS